MTAAISEAANGEPPKIKVGAVSATLTGSGVLRIFQLRPAVIRGRELRPRRVGVGRPHGRAHRSFFLAGPKASSSPLMKVRLMHPAVGEIAFPLKPGGSLVIGRLGSSTDVEISWDPRISRRHCRLWEKDGRVWFQDLASRNGSWIGSDKVSGVVRLSPGSSVLIGETVLLVPPAGDEEAEVEETHERPLTEKEASILESLTPRPNEELSAREQTVQLRLAVADLAAARGNTPPPRGHTLPPREAPPLVHASSEASTQDLRSHSVADAPLPPLSPSKEVRGAPRFVSSRRVKLRARDREDLRDLWMRDISKGGLFVETKVPPEPGTALEVHLETPAGTVQLEGVVVHLLSDEMARSFGGQPGVGIQFLNLDINTRDAIQAYVDGLANQLEGGSSDLQHMSEAESEEILQKARDFLHKAESADFYSALGVTPSAGNQRIEQVADRLHRELSAAVERITPTRAARLEAAVNVLNRVKRILTHEEGRLEYDFRNGHVRAQDRVTNAQAGQKPSLNALREAWNRVYPERVDRAALLTRKAFAARQRQDLAAAIDAGRAALELNPFFLELKQNIEAWETLGERR